MNKSRMMNDAPNKLRLDDQLCFALYAATNAVTRAYRSGLGSIGLTYPQYLVMLVLWQDGERSSSEIARRLCLGANAVSPLLDRLERSGFILRLRDGRDRRVVRVRLTDAGAALESAVAEVQRSVVCETGLPPEALAALREELKELASRMAPAAAAAEDHRDKTMETVR